MINEEMLQMLYRDCRDTLGPGYDNDPAPGQIYRGITPNLWKNNPYVANCRRHDMVFLEFDVIPKYCFNCYKIQVKLNNVVELLKLMIMFNRIKLPDDNTRKCYIEVRPNVAGSYSGLIYFQDLQEAKNALNDVAEIVEQQIAPDIPVFIKRGCSEFPQKYPDYGILDDDYNPTMQYKDGWEEIENKFDQNNLAGDLTPLGFDTYNHSGLSEYECRVVINWMRYAEAIGDLSYRGITNSVVAALPGLIRP